MAHIVFYDTNEVGLDALRTASALGHRFTFVDPVDFKRYAPTEANSAAIGGAARIVPVRMTAEPETAFAALRRILAEEPIDALIGLNEYSIDALADAAARLGIPFTNGEAVATARRKHLMRQRLDDA